MIAHSCWLKANRLNTNVSVLRLWAAAALLLAWILPHQSTAQTVDTSAEFAYLIDLSSDTVLMEKKADVPTAPASMSKMMTVLMVFERLKSGTLSMDDTFPVSEKAWRKGGSKMFVEVGSRVSVEDLLRGIIVQSGNDACIVVAEGLAGSEAAFAAEMTARAQEIGLEDSYFTNSTGWPEDGHEMSARDLARVAGFLIEEYPDYYRMFAEKTFEYHDIRQSNRNPLLYDGTGADGLKTGHTEEAGYGLTASAKRGDRRLILVLNGMDSAETRAREAERLLEWGFRYFEAYPLFKTGQVVEHAPVWLGDRETVPMVLDQDLTVTLSRSARSGMEVSIRYEAPIASPVRKGNRIGTLVVTAPDTDPVERPLVAQSDVEALGPAGRVLRLARHWIGRWIP